MAELDRSHWGFLGVGGLAILLVAACSTSVPMPLEAPAGTSSSPPAPEETPVAEPTETEPAEIEAPILEAIAVAAEPEPPPAPEPEDDTLVMIDTGAKDVTERPQTLAEPPPAPEPEDDTLVMIDTGAKDVTERPQTLAEAAQAERERRNVAAPTDIVLTDKTLEDFATGDLTVAAPPSPAQKAQETEASELREEIAAKEAYWRGGAREIRQAWRDAYDKIPLLEEKVFQLRQDFFREDNGFYRDGEIKPAWDRAIEQLEEAHLEVEARQEELAVFLEGGREAGALPGWLREGIDLEPQPRAPEEVTAEPGEPVIYQQEATDPP